MKKIENTVLTIRFMASINSSMRWNFKPQQYEIKVVPGETALAFYRAKNPTDQPVVGISTYNVIPFEAGPYFNKIQCFCFEAQQLNPHEEVSFPFSSSTIRRLLCLFFFSRLICRFSSISIQNSLTTPKWSSLIQLPCLTLFSKRKRGWTCLSQTMLDHIEWAANKGRWSQSIGTCLIRERIKSFTQYKPHIEYSFQ